MLGQLTTAQQKLAALLADPTKKVGAGSNRYSFRKSNIGKSGTSKFRESRTIHFILPLNLYAHFALSVGFRGPWVIVIIVIVVIVIDVRSTAADRIERRGA